MTLNLIFQAITNFFNIFRYLRKAVEKWSWSSSTEYQMIDGEQPRILRMNITHESIDFDYNMMTELPIHFMDRKYTHFCLICKNKIIHRHILHKYYSNCDCDAIYQWYTSVSEPNFFRKLLISRAKKRENLRKQLNKWWKSKNIEFLCCHCFDVLKIVKKLVF